MSRRPFRALLLLAALAAAGCASAPAPRPEPAAPWDAALGLATFDSAWARVNAHHYDSTFGGVDWPGVRAELRPRAEAARSNAELRAVVLDMVRRLGVSHYTLIPREVTTALAPERTARSRRDGADEPGADPAADAAEDEEGAPADAGLELRIVDGGLAVWRVRPGGAAERTGIVPGRTVSAIDGADLEAAQERIASLPVERERVVARATFLHAVNGMLRGETGDTVRLALGAAEVAVPLAASGAREVRLGHLPPLLARLESERRPAGDGCVGVISFTTWLTPLSAEFDRALDTMRDCRGIVIDLRGNPGGVAGMVMGLGGHFVDSTRALGTLRLRRNELRYVVNPRRADSQGRPVAVYDGALAILVDGMSASTSEIFAAGLQAIGRARVFGEVSSGQALTAVATALPNGDVLMHAIADYLVIDGSRIEGRGVLPDEPVPLRAEDVRAGRDAPLEAAIAWILKRPDPTGGVRP